MEKNFGKDCFRTERFRTNLVREVFGPQSRAKNVRTWKIFELHQYRNPKILHGKKNVKIASELSVLEPIKQGKFFIPNLGQKMYVHEKILSCLNMNLHDKKNKGSFLSPLSGKKCTYMKKFWAASIWIYMKKKWIFKQSSAPTLATLAGAAAAWPCWDKWMILFWLSYTTFLIWPLFRG